MFQFKYTVFDGNSKLFNHEESIEALQSAQTFVSECKKCGCPCNVTIRDNEKNKSYTIEQLERRIKNGK